MNAHWNFFSGIISTDKTGFSNAGFVQKKPPTVYLPEALIAVKGICPVKEQIP